MNSGASCSRHGSCSHCDAPTMYTTFISDYLYNLNRVGVCVCGEGERMTSPPTAGVTCRPLATVSNAVVLLRKSFTNRSGLHAPGRGITHLHSTLSATAIHTGSMYAVERDERTGDGARAQPSSARTPVHPAPHCGRQGLGQLHEDPDGHEVGEWGQQECHVRATPRADQVAHERP